MIFYYQDRQHRFQVASDGQKKLEMYNIQHFFIIKLYEIIKYTESL